MDARSLRSVGRPVFGRPAAAAVLVASIAMLAVGAPGALAEEAPSGAAVADVPEAAPEASVVPAEPAGSPPPEAQPQPAGSPPPDAQPHPDGPPPPESVVEDVPADEAPVDEAPVEETPVEPPPSDTAEPNAPAADPPAAEPAPPSGGTAPVTTTQSPATDAPDGGTPAPPESSDSAGTGGAVAQNVSMVIQAVWQVQQGCRSYCYGTSQTQTSTQWSQTTQSASAVAGESDSGGAIAGARNESSTIQFVWQMQIGCVAFCYDTSQSQEAAQYASTEQDAEAQSALMAWAENLAETVQYVFQSQRGCEHECHRVSQSQSSTQAGSTSQSASANGLGEGDGPGHVLLPDWLVAFAENIGATIQTIYQYQEALCLEHCVGGSQIQEASQRAETDQRAVARAGPPPEQPVSGELPPAPQPPAPAPAPDGGSAAPGAATPLLPAMAGSVPTLREPRARKSARRRELGLDVLPQRSGDGPATPAGPGIVPDGLGVARPAADPPASESSSERRASDRPGAAGQAPDEQLPASTVTVDSGPTSDGSPNWLAIALMAAAFAALIAAFRGRLATSLSRI